MATIRQWLRDNGLKLADHKTEFVLVSSRKRREEVAITVGNQEIRSQPCLKYLGLRIDARLTFKDPTRKTC